MVDCGGGANATGAGREVADGVIVPWLARRGIERIDAVAVTHWDTDHCNALPRVLSLVPAEMLLLPPELPNASVPAPLRQSLPSRPQHAAVGGRLALGDDVTARLLAPRHPLLRGTGDDANANSVVMMLSHGAVRLLMTGDIGRAAGRRLVRDARNTGRSLRADVLVLPHHGRGLRELEPLLDAVRPRWAIASCDDDADRYLGEEEMALLVARGIRLLRTDRHGAVRVLSDGQRVTVNASRGPRSLGSRVAAARR
jgi:competence protein ComEC